MTAKNVVVKVGAATAVAAALTVAVSCAEDDGDRLILLVKCSDYKPEQGHIVRFDIDSFTTDGSIISELQISSVDNEYGTQLLTTIPVKAEKYSDYYEYRVPSFNGRNVSLDMRFRAVASGTDRTMTVKLSVSSTAMPDELNGIQLWSPASGRTDGYSLSQRTAIYVSESDDDDIDIFIPAGSADDVLARTLRSRTGLRFVKADNFNYQSASAVSLNETFVNSVKSSSADDLKVGDTILFGRDNEALGVIRIKSIDDFDGAANDSVIFDMKLL